MREQRLQPVAAAKRGYDHATQRVADIFRHQDGEAFFAAGEIHESGHRRPARGYHAIDAESLPWIGAQVVDRRVRPR